MSDIVERLRNGCSCNFPDTPCGAEHECRAAFDAADEITRLRAENERLRAALRHIECDEFDHANEAQEMRDLARAALARAALAAQPAPGKEGENE